MYRRDHPTTAAAILTNHATSIDIAEREPGGAVAQGRS
jgi:hypothetical protein